MIVNVVVTAEHVARGVPDSVGIGFNPCPIGLAIREVVRPSEPIIVLPWAVAFGSCSVSLPDEARRWMRQHDQGVDVGPITFPLDVPKWLLREGKGS